MFILFILICALIVALRRADLTSREYSRLCLCIGNGEGDQAYT
jgi:hypothetical protein